MSADELPERTSDWSLTDIVTGSLMAGVGGWAFADPEFGEAFLGGPAMMIPFLSWRSAAFAIVAFGILFVIVLAPPTPRRYVDEWERDLYER